MSDSSTIIVQLEKLTYGGDAMGRLEDGRAVFVPFCLPGEKVRVRLTEERKGFARGELVEILEPAAERIQARCPHFGTCGGCHYQNLPYEKQLEIKQEILRDQLRRIGRIENPPVAQAVPSPNPWNYRNHVQFHLTGDARLGYVDARGRQVFPITECHLPEAGINLLWPELQFEANAGIERVSLRQGEGDDLMLVLESNSPEPPELEIEADISVVHLFEEHPVVLAGADHIWMRVLDQEFHVSAASFFQVNTPMAGKMVERLLAELPLSRSDTVLDLYCGAGLFSKFLARKAGRVIGVESSTSACEDYGINLDEFDHVELYESTAEEALPALAAQHIQPTWCVLDPPRAGADRKVLEALKAMGPHRIAYISCDPSTLARDAKHLSAAGYRLLQVTPFDLFPQTYHIESISVFEK